MLEQPETYLAGISAYLCLVWSRMSRSLTPFIAALATWPARQAARSKIQSMQSLWSSERVNEFETGGKRV